jgi:hypothetical protein
VAHVRDLFWSVRKAGFERKRTPTKLLHVFQFSFGGVKLVRSYEIAVLEGRKLLKEAVTDGLARTIELAGEPALQPPPAFNNHRKLLPCYSYRREPKCTAANCACQSICLLMGTIASATRAALKFLGLAR